jgi:hypothetical protein
MIRGPARRAEVYEVLGILSFSRPRTLASQGHSKGGRVGERGVEGSHIYSFIHFLHWHTVGSVGER